MQICCIYLWTVCVFCCALTVDQNNELPADFDEEFFREIHQKGGNNISSLSLSLSISQSHWLYVFVLLLSRLQLLPITKLLALAIFPASRLYFKHKTRYHALREKLCRKKITHIGILCFTTVHRHSCSHCHHTLFVSLLFVLLRNLNKLCGLGERCKPLPARSRVQPGQKRIWCTLKLSESHWWQSFSVFWSWCFRKLDVAEGVTDCCWGGGGVDLTTQSPLSSPAYAPVFRPAPFRNLWIRQLDRQLFGIIFSLTVEASDGGMYCTLLYGPTIKDPWATMRQIIHRRVSLFTAVRSPYSQALSV